MFNQMYEIFYKTSLFCALLDEQVDLYGKKPLFYTEMLAAKNQLPVKHQKDIYF
jgi:hypothetical protein